MEMEMEKVFGAEEGREFEGSLSSIPLRRATSFAA